MTYNLFTTDACGFVDCGRPKFTRYGVWVANYGEWNRFFGPFVRRKVIMWNFVPYDKIAELNRHRSNIGQIGV